MYIGELNAGKTAAIYCTTILYFTFFFFFFSFLFSAVK